MTMNPPVSLPPPTIPAPRSPYSNVDANRLSQNSVSRFKRMADSTNQKFAAELLLQMRRIATDELAPSVSSTTLSSPPPSAAVHLISPMQRPKPTAKVFHATYHADLSRLGLPNNPATPYTPRLEPNIHLHEEAPTRILKVEEDISSKRFRAVSIGGVNDLEVPSMHGNVSPFHLDSRHHESPVDVKTKPLSTGSKHPEDRWNPKNAAASNLVSAKSSFESEEDEDDDEEMTKSEDDEVTVPKRTTTAPPKKYVGDTLAPGVTVRDVLRKKFSWKSFPELESYLIAHRIPYLACSNAMNYTKAQKQYNNELTQGLLDLAATEGYIFEGFSFAMVRDRIRCFYKSFVQATKKKKRPSVKPTTTNSALLAKRIRADTV